MERDRTYADAAMKRIDAVEPAPDIALETTKGKRAQPRIPFGRLLEAGLIAPGTELTCAKGRNTAVVRADGSLETGGVTGSIHKIGAHVQGLEACNGWTYWHFEEGKARRPIDDLRQIIRDGMAAA